MIAQRTIEEIRARADIVDVIQSYIALKRAGANFKALCPFHREKTPSFMVSPQRQMFHCFGCGAGGDVFGFVMKQEGVDFATAVRLLAERTGVVIETARRADREESAKLALYQLHAEVAALYHATLLTSPAADRAREYLHERALNEDVAESFQIGYAPESWDFLIRWASEKGYSLSLLEQAGLVIRKPGEEPYDRFRDRLMFPIADSLGRVIAFSGRTLGPATEGAKYVNSPETPLFRKSRVLYGLDKARRFIVDAREAILCEGQIDVIRCHQAGFRAAVASQGTAFTAEHAAILQRYADAVCLAFDSDRAGQDGAIKVAGLFLSAGLAVRIAALPPGEDTDVFIRKRGAEAFDRLLHQAESAVAFHIRVLSARENRQTEVGTLRIARAALQTIAASPNAVQRAKLIQDAARALDLPPTALQEEYRRLTARGALRSPEGTAETSRLDTAPEYPREEIALCEHAVRMTDFPEIRDLLVAYLPLEMISHTVCRTIVRCALQAAEEGVELQTVLNREEDASGEVHRLAARLLLAPSKVCGKESSPVQAVQDLILFLWRRRLQKVRAALPAGDPASSARRAQLTYDLKNLRSWAQGSVVIRIALGH